MQLTAEVTCAGPGKLVWAVRDERYRVSAVCWAAHTHASGVVRYPVDATQSELDEAGRVAHNACRAARDTLYRDGLVAYRTTLSDEARALLDKQYWAARSADHAALDAVYRTAYDHLLASLHPAACSREGASR